MSQTVLGIFDNKNDAENAINSLKNDGFHPKDISIVMKGDHTITQKSVDNPVAEDAASGVVTGGVIGGIAGLLIGVGAIAIPGIGALLIGGPLAAAMGITGAAASTVSGVATGAVAGGIIGALVGWGVSEEEAHVYEERVKKGAILVAVHADDVSTARKYFEDNNAEEIRTLT